jgi:hypothetical protein
LPQVSFAAGAESVVDRSIVIRDANNAPLACANIVHADDYGCVQVQAWSVRHAAP